LLDDDQALDDYIEDWKASIKKRAEENKNPKQSNTKRFEVG